MATPSVKQLLSEIELGRQLGDKDRECLAGLAEALSVEPGATIFHEGRRHLFVYWIAEGQVSLEMGSSNMTAQPLLTLATGDVLAWSALLSDRRMSATAKAKTPTTLIQFETTQLLELCEQNHAIGYRVMQHLAAQLARRLLATRLQLLDLFSSPNQN